MALRPGQSCSSSNRRVLAGFEGKRYRRSTSGGCDRLAQIKDNEGRKLSELLDEFAQRRRANLEEIKKLTITEDMLEKTGIHPSFGVVSLGNLLTTWMTHDLNHIYQITRVLAKQFKEETGPWVEYLRVLRD